MNLFVTGGCGFIGSNFIRRHLSSGASPLRRLINLDKLTYAGNMANLADCMGDSRYLFEQGDIADETHITRLLVAHQIDAVINFAAETHVDRSIDSGEPFIQANVVGTMRLLNASRRYWTSLEDIRKKTFRFLHISTDEVYGSLAPKDPQTAEGLAFAPNSPYAASKAASDHLVRAYQQTYQLPTLTINSSNNYGSYQFPEKLIPLMILNALEGRPLPIYGDGQNIRDWLAVEDHIDAIWLVLANGRVGETYNVGGGLELTNLEVIQRLCALLDTKAPRPDGGSHSSQIVFVPDRPGHDRRYSLNCAKIQRELGWSPKVSFAKGLAKTVDWYLNHRAWCDDVTAKKYARERLGTCNLSP